MAMVVAIAMIAVKAIVRTTKNIAKIEHSSTKINQGSHIRTNMDSFNNSLHCYNGSCLSFYS
jgi:hypothetical protein